MLSSFVGIPLGAWIGLTRGRAVTAAKLITHTGMALPPVVVGLVLYILLSRSGPLGSLGWLLTTKAMILAQFVLSLPFVVGITMAAVAAVPAELRIQLRSLGATPWQSRWQCAPWHEGGLRGLRLAGVGARVDPEQPD